MDKLQQSRAELEEHLQEQIDFLRDRAEGFDRGKLTEAKWMAVVVRTLVHDTGRSQSLLGQLGRKDLPFLGTAKPVNPANILPQPCLLAWALTSKGSQFVALLDRLSEDRKQPLPFDEWWDQTVIYNMGEAPLSRKEVVLSLANQDGGAHVDSALKEPYARFSRLNALQAYEVDPAGNKRPLARPELVTMRQIAHEVLKTLIPGYMKLGPTPPPPGPPAQPGQRYSIEIKGPYIHPTGHVTSYRDSIRGRQEPSCPCGSGLAHRDCCGRK